jgi:hypothetical protein
MSINKEEQRNERNKKEKRENISEMIDDYFADETTNKVK